MASGDNSDSPSNVAIAAMGGGGGAMATWSLMFSQ